VLVVIAALLGACSAGASSDAERPAPSAASATDDLAAHTPADLRHPCDLVTRRTATRLLGVPVAAREVSSELAPRTLACRYAQGAGPPLLEIRSTPDPTSLDSLVRLYIGVDRLPHHPVDARGADAGEAVLDPGHGVLTVFVKQGFVTHTVVLADGDPPRDERTAVSLAELVVAGNR
jgi:hypothetical protein